MNQQAAAGVNNLPVAICISLKFTAPSQAEYRSTPINDSDLPPVCQDLNCGRLSPQAFVVMGHGLFIADLACFSFPLVDPCAVPEIYIFKSYSAEYRPLQ